MYLHLSKKLITGLLLVGVLGVALAPTQTVHAQDSGGQSGLGGIIVNCTGLGSAIAGALGSALGTNVPTDDTKNNAKEGCLDGIASAFASMMLKFMTADIINWINSGFQGDPLFIENPKAFYGDIANEISGQFIEALGASAICEPFRPQITIALAQQDTFLERSQCTFLDGAANVQAFIDDFGNGGWAGWISLTQQPQNNPYGAYFMAADEHNRRLAEGVGNARDQVSWGDGFRPFQECVEEAEGHPGIGDTYCARWETRTPGQLIAGQAEFSLTIDGRKLLNADEINEALGMVLDALINQLITTGFRSLTAEDGTSAWTEHEDEKEQVVGSLTQVRDNTQQYIENRRAANDIMRETHGVLGEVIACREEIADIDQTTSLKDRQRELTSTIEDYQSEVADIQQNIPRLDEMIGRAEGAESSRDTIAILNEYSSISSLFPSEENLAQSERDLRRHRSELARAEQDLETCQKKTDTEPRPIPVNVISLPGGEEEEGEEGEESSEEE